MTQAQGCDQLRILVLQVFTSGYVTRAFQVKVSLSPCFIAHNAITVYAGVNAYL